MNLKLVFGILCLSLIMMSCGSDSAEKYVGTWTGDVNCLGDVNEVSLAIVLGASDDEVFITIDAESPQIKATVNGDNLILEKTRIDDGDDDYTDVSGSGSINSDGDLSMSFIIEVYENGVLDQEGVCSGIFTM